MSPFKTNLQRFLTLFFTAISIVIVVMGIARTRKNAEFALIPPEQGSATPPAQDQQAGIVAGTSTPVDTANAIAFSGSSYQTPWGKASASIQVKNGRVVAVTMPQVPNSPPSQYAEQFLVQQALESGTANIQGVSGATFTSLAFKSSLESAIAQAKAQGQTISGGITTGTPTSVTSGKTKAKPAVPRQYREDDDDNNEFEWD